MESLLKILGGVFVGLFTAAAGALGLLAIHICCNCGFEFTGYQKERDRTQAVRNYLAH